MTTGLWGVTSGISAARLTEAVPPSCRRVVEAVAPSAFQVHDGEALVTAPEWPTPGATHFVPSFSAFTSARSSVRFELSARIGGAWSPWMSTVGLGPELFDTQRTDGPLSVDVDTFRTTTPAEAVRLRLRMRARDPSALLAAPWALTLSASDAGVAPDPVDTSSPPVRLVVPSLSQMEAEPGLAHRICSPTCVAMVLHYWRRPVAVTALAREMFHPATDLYGVWPAAILAAARRGIAGYLLRFPDWTAAAWCLAKGLPVIASVRYAAGELTGAAANATGGHLLVLTGYDDGVALVNDPAAPTAATVPRRYPLNELTQVWLTRSAVGYVLFPLNAT